MTERTNHKPRHLYDTGKFKTLPPERQVRPQMFDNAPKNGGPHLAADGSKVQSWPTDPQPTKAVQPPTPRPYAPAPNVVVEPPMSAKDALTMEKACLYGAVLVAVLGVVILIAVNVAGVS